ncbi:hypothetical protein RhiirA1_540657 [Rhizophagus irregularis]|uniref:Uncharacterized protein n=1 Tax=Rhizophagus irregularis TaxID=588596 RepID=A0A2N0R790_9GLOM|nr:hypothetical protein RhiirA1_540657 [Rhizophagus irregularis]
MPANVFGGKEEMAVLEGEINVISILSGWTVQFVAISTIRSATLPKLEINVKFILGDDSEEQKNSLN